MFPTLILQDEMEKEAFEEPTLQEELLREDFLEEVAEVRVVMVKPGRTLKSGKIRRWVEFRLVATRADCPTTESVLVQLAALIPLAALSH